MRLQIDLPREVRYVETSDVVVDEGQRHDQGQETGTVLLDQAQQLGAGVAVETFAEVAEHVVENVHLPARRGEPSERLHEGRLVTLAKLMTPMTPHIAESIYQTLDGSEAGVWNQQTRSWEPLAASYRTAIRQGLRIARKQAAPDMIRLPLPAAEGEQG